MQRIFALCLLLFVPLSADLSWQPERVLFAEVGSEVVSVEIAEHPSEFLASAAWVVISKDNQGAQYYSIYTALFDGVSWSPPVSFGAFTAEPHPRISMDGEGRVIVLWDGYDGVSLRVGAAVYSGGVWSNEIPLASLGNEYYPANPNLSMNSSGVAVALWVSPENVIVGSTYQMATGNFSSTYPISQAGVSIHNVGPVPLLVSESGLCSVVIPRLKEVDGVSFDPLHPPTSPQNQFLSLFSVASLYPQFLANANGFSLTLFQDQTSGFMIGGSLSQTGWNFTVAGVPPANCSGLTLGISEVSSRSGAGWVYGNGSIEVGFYNSGSWLFTKILSRLGNSPAIGLYRYTLSDQVTDEMLVIWSDRLVNSGMDTVVAREYVLATNSWENPVLISSPSPRITGCRLISKSDGFSLGMWVAASSISGTPVQALHYAIGEPIAK